MSRLKKLSPLSPFSLVIIKKKYCKSSSQHASLMHRSCPSQCLSEGADITVPPSVSFRLSHCCSEARKRRMRRARTQGHLLQLCPSSFSLLPPPPLPLRWSICHCREGHGSLDQSNYCWEQLWRDGGRGSMETESVEGKKSRKKKRLNLKHWGGEGLNSLTWKKGIGRWKHGVWD